MEKADALGKMLAEHPAVEKFQQAQKAVSEDADANRLIQECNRQLESLARAQQSGMGITEQQQQQIEMLQGQIMSHLKIKALNLAQVEFVDLLRKVNQGVQRQVASEMSGALGGAAPAGSASSAGPLQM